VRSLSYRTFQINDKKYSFSRNGFNKAIQDYRLEKSFGGKVIKLNDAFQDIADELNISVEAIKKWRYGHNGPGDLDIIKSIASVMNCDYMNLLIEHDSEESKISDSNISIDMNIVGEEKDIMRSLLGDLLSLIEDYSSKGFPETGFWECDDITDYYLKWMTEISIKLKKASFMISRDSYNRFENLYLETRSFIDYCGSRQITRWCNINHVFILFACMSIDEIREFTENDLDWDLLVNSDEYYLDDSVRELLRNELEPYSNGHICWDPPLWLIGMKFGTWYLDIVRHDFPELFLD